MPSIETTTTANPETGWLGQLRLIYAHKKKQTQVADCQTQAPLRVQRPFYPEGPNVCHTVLLHTAGGMVGGDRLHLNLQLHPHTHTLLTTAAAAKIYRSNGLESLQTVNIKIAAGSTLEWLPQESILFNQGIYRQDLRVDLEPGAHWLGWELTRFGRSARGEKFVQGNWRSHTEIWQDQQPLWIDRQWLPGNTDLFHSPHGLAGYPVAGSLAWVGQVVEPDLVTQARAVWQGDSSTGEVGVTRLQQGLLCRYRGTSTVDARSWLIAVWQLIRLSYLGRPICVPRVWPI